MNSSDSPRPEIRVGVSACLLGEEVRYDGAHARDRYVTDILADHFALVPVCPEAEIGMGIPRETIRLEGDVDAPDLVAPRSGTDWTKRMNRWSRGRARQLAAEDLCGFVFKKNSPSCGLWRVKVHGAKGMPVRKGRGLFAAEMAERFPLLPLEEEGRLHDPGLRENFLERVFAYARVREAFRGRWKRRDVLAFHAREKYLLMAHSPAGQKELGRLAARIADLPPAEFRDRYFEGYMGTLAVHATTRRHVNALNHLAGHLRDFLDGPTRQRLAAVITEYGRGLVPLVVPMTLLRHYIELHEAPYVSEQTYLNPHPRELMLRNHV